MKQRKEHLIVTTPGRICLFGEHQDYLGLPVIAAAISLRISIEMLNLPRTSEVRGKSYSTKVRVELPDINSHVSFTLNKQIRYRNERDYFRSGVNVLRRNGFTFSQGFDCVVHGEIPIAAGTSSSSALTVAWITFLARMSDQRKILSSKQCAKYAYQTEVLEFREPGGMMDQVTTAYGGILHLSFFPRLIIKPVSTKLGTIVLGDSQQPKDTMKILARVKNHVLEIVGRLQQFNSDVSLQTISFEECKRNKVNLNNFDKTLLSGTLQNRDITIEALNLLQKKKLDEEKFGALLNCHQTILRDILKISTRKIDRMLDAAMNAGALGGKINGSGGGGCMFAYAPKNPEQVAEAIERAGGRAYIIHVDGGTRLEERT
ncbi:MAG: GHMP kinase [Ignavibacteriae bacterium]|nr:GHMP kinase [Ignavibacteriota bacterium]